MKKKTTKIIKFQSKIHYYNMLKAAFLVLLLLTSLSVTLGANNDRSINGITYQFIHQGEGDRAFLGRDIKVSFTRTDEEGNPLRGKDDYYREASYKLGLEEDFQQWDILLLEMKEGDRVLVEKKKTDNEEEHSEHYLIELIDVYNHVETKPYDIPGKTRITTESGLQYIIISEGSGVKAGPGYEVVFHFTGYLEDKTIFASSYEESQPVHAVLGFDEMIRGWFEGLCLMREGDEMRLIVPPDLAYGEEGLEDTVPPNTTLIFDIEMLEVK